MITTLDSILDGAVVLEQPAPGTGYRFNVDSVHLARFVAQRIAPGAHLVDLGCGVGTVALCVAAMAQPSKLTLVDLNESSCELARRNADRAGLGHITTVLNGELSSWSPPDLAASYVVANPPYTLAHEGRPSARENVDRARHGDLMPFVRAAARILAHDGHLALCYPSRSLTRLLSVAADVGLNPTRITFVHPNEGDEARLVLAEFSNAAPVDFELTPPLVEAG